MTLSDETEEQPTFIAETLAGGVAEVTYTFSLTVTDSAGVVSAPDTVSITVIPAPFPPPVANAGPDQSVLPGMFVRLDGGATTIGRNTGNALLESYNFIRWRRIGGTSKVIPGLTAVINEAFQRTFTAQPLSAGDDSVTHIFELWVQDQNNVEDRDTVTITVLAPLVADAGPDQPKVRSGTTVTLDGSGSTPTGNGRIVSYAWVDNGDDAIMLDNATGLNPTFVADTLIGDDPDVTYVFTLTVTDDAGSDMATDTVTITITDPFDAPVANAGDDQTVDSGKEVTLDGSGSTFDDRGSITSYIWTRTSGTGGTLTDENTVTPTFTAQVLNPGDTDATHVFELMVTDDAGQTSTDTVMITVTAPPFPALVAEAGTGKTVDHETVVDLVGTGSTVSDSTRTITYAWARTGGTGDSSVAPSDPAALLTSFTAETLIPGIAPVTHIFTLTVTDNQESAEASDTVTFTVNPPPFPALVAEAGTGKTVDHEAVVDLVGTGSTVSDSTRTITYAWARTGGTGDSSVAPSDPAALLTSFTAETLIPGIAPVTHIFTLTVTDNQESAEASDTVTFTVNPPPFPDLVASAGDDKEVDSGQAVTLDGSGTASDSVRTVSYLWTRSGTGGTLTGDTTLTPSFTAPGLTAGAADVTYVFTLTVTDDQSSTPATDTVNVTVKAPPLGDLVASAGDDKDVDSGQTVTLDGSGTASDSVRTVSYLWTRSGTGGTLTGDTTLTPSFTAPGLTAGAADVTYVFTLTVTDDQSSTPATDTVNVTVKAPPLGDLVASAGDDKDVDSGQTVTLDGSGTASDSVRTVSYLWTRSGTGGTLTGDTTLTPSFTAPGLTAGAADVTYVFTLTVTDDQSSTPATDTVNVTVKAPPLGDLVASAGDDKDVDSGQTVTLDGSGTASDSVRTVSYLWTRSGTGGTLTGDTTLTPSFTAPGLTAGAADVTYVFTLTVTDDQSSTPATDTVNVTVKAPPLGDLVASAGDDKDVDSGQTVTLDGSGTASDSVRTVSYLWTRSGTGGTLTGDTTLTPSFTAPGLTAGAADVTYVFTLTVTDDQSSTPATDTVNVTVKAPPLGDLVASAGDDKDVDSGQTVTLDGSGTASDSVRTVSYLWTRSGTGGTLTGDTTLTPSFTAPGLTAGAADVTYVFTLTVTDDQSSTPATDTVNVTVKAPPLGDLVASAGDDKDVDSGQTVTLDGSGTASDSVRTVSYLWTRSGTGGTLTGDTTLTPSFTAPGLTAGAADVTYVFTLTVTDDQSSTPATDTVNVTVKAPPLGDLVASAGDDKDVDSGQTVTLDGSGTASDSVRTVSYLWTRSGTGGTLTGDTTLTPSFTAPGLTAGAADVTYVFTLTVTDDQSSTPATDTVNVTVKAPPLGDLVASAGDDKDVDSGQTVTLDGSGTASDSVRTVSYLWTRSGTGGTLTGDTTLTPSFTAPGLTAGAADVTYVFTLTVTDDQSSTPATDTVNVTVKAPPLGDLVASAGDDKDVDSGQTVTLDGSGTASDSVRTVSYLWTRSGTGGTLTGDTTLTPSFTAPGLTAGAADVTYVFTLTVTDDQSSTPATDTVNVTVKAPPFPDLVAVAGTGGTVSHEAMVPLVGTGSTVSDSNRTITYAWARTGGTGDSSVAPENPAALVTSFTSETLNSGATAVTHIFTLTVTDNQGSAAVTDTVIFTVNPPGVTALVAEAGNPLTVASGEMVTLDGSGSTVSDSTRTVTYAWTRTGGTGDSSVTAVNPAALQTGFTATDDVKTQDDAVTHIFTLTVTDTDDNTAADTVQVTVEEPFAAPVADAGGRRVVSAGSALALRGDATPDRRRTIVSWLWEWTDGPDGSNVRLTNANSERPGVFPSSPPPGANDEKHTLTLRVTDSAGIVSEPDTVEVTVEAAPLANAGPDQSVASGATVMLDGSGSIVNQFRGPLYYTWERTGGTGDNSVTLAEVEQPTFTADTLAAGAVSVTHIFELVVEDNIGNPSASDTVTIRVHAPLVADAGPDQLMVRSGTTVTLDGSGSTATGDGRTVTYAWERTGGTGDDTVMLSNTAVLDPTFMAERLTGNDADVTHEFTLTLTDDAGSEVKMDTVTITITDPFDAPVANAGPDQGGQGQTLINPGDVVTLDGSNSTVDRRSSMISHAWRRTSGDATATLTGARTVMPSFTAEMLDAGTADAIHVFELTVTDDAGQTSTDTVMITVTSGFADPVAMIVGGNRTVASGTQVTLESTGSSVDRRRGPISYRWTATDANMGSVALTGERMATASFTPELVAGVEDEIYTLTLIVTDSANETATATVTITVTSGFADPVAMIAGGNRTVASGTLLTLESTGSSVDRRRGPISYSWTGTDGAMGSVTLTGENTATASFTPELVAGVDDEVYSFTLIVTDSANNTATDTVMITVTSGFADPVAMIVGGNRSVTSGTTVTLESTGSSVDRRRGPISYTWRGTDGAMGSAALTGERTATASFTPELVAGAEDETYTLTLMVTDSANESATAMVTITVISEVVETVANAAVEGEEPGKIIRVPSGQSVTLDGRDSVIDYRRLPASYSWARTGGTPGASVDDFIGADTEQPGFTANILAVGDPDVTHIFTLTVTDSTGASDTDTVTVIVFAVAQVDIHVSQSELTVQEGGSDSYRVRLSESPGREITVMAVSDNEDKLVLGKAEYVFNSDNWNIWQVVNITAVADSDIQNDAARIRHTLVDAVGGTPVIVTVTIREVDPILRPIGEFLVARATALLNSQPDLTRFIKQDGITPGGGSFTFQATDGHLALDGGFIHNGVWGEVTGYRVNRESGNTRSVLGSLGIHRKYSENFLAGALLQFDFAKNELGALNGRTGMIDGTGWLAGPYFVARHDSQPLYFEGRLLYGQSDNDIRFMDTGLGVMRTGSFDSRRLLAQLRVEGEIALSGWDNGETVPRLIPYADARWTQDRANAFIDNGGIRVLGQKVSTGQLELGSNIEFPIAMRTGAMTVNGGFGLVWSNTKGDYITSDSGGRGRGEIGFSYNVDDNLRIGFESFYDGIGSSRYEGYGLSLSAEMKF